MQRIRMDQVFEDPWFKEGYKPPKSDVEEEFNGQLDDDVDEVFSNAKVWIEFIQLKQFYIAITNNCLLVALMNSTELIL